MTVKKESKTLYHRQKRRKDGLIQRFYEARETWKIYLNPATISRKKKGALHRVLREGFESLKAIDLVSQVLGSGEWITYLKGIQTTNRKIRPSGRIF